MQNRGEYKRIIRPYVSQFLVEIIVLKKKPKIREDNKALPEPVTRCIFCHLQLSGVKDEEVSNIKDDIVQRTCLSSRHV